MRLFPVRSLYATGSSSCFLRETTSETTPPAAKDVSLQELAALLEGCSPTETRVLVDIATAAKKSFDKHRQND